MAELVRIYAEDNNFQHAEVLRRNRVKRQKNREFFVEGVKPIELALRNGWQVSAFLYSRDRALSGWATGILSSSPAERHMELPGALMAKLSEREEPSELIALVRMRPDDPARIPLSSPFLALVLDRPASPGNIGMIIRACDAFGASGAVVTGHAADVYDPKAVRASVGTLFSVPVVRMGSHAQLLAWIAQARARFPDLEIVGTSARGTASLAEHPFARPTVLLLGNETSGLSVQYKAMCDTLLRIPMRGAASSLNVASAASIALYEWERRQGRR